MENTNSLLNEKYRPIVLDNYVGNDKLKKDLKDKKISQDENQNSVKKIQILTDNQIVELEKKLKEKEKEIMTI